MKTKLIPLAALLAQGCIYDVEYHTPRLNTQGVFTLSGESTQEEGKAGFYKDSDCTQMITSTPVIQGRWKITLHNPEFESFKVYTKDEDTIYQGCSELGPFERIRPLPTITTARDGQLGIFVLKDSGQKFTLQGVNHTRSEIIDHATFDVEMYDREVIMQALSEMAQSQYNMVRVFLNPRDLEGPSKFTLNQAYIDNLVDFLALATAQGMYVILTGEWAVSSYTPHSIASNLQRGWNSLFMSGEQVRITAQFWKDLLLSIKSRDPGLLSTIMGIDLQNEGYYSERELPFNQTRGSFTSHQGKTYDLSNLFSRQLLAEDMTRYWINTINSSIKEVSDILVSASVFSPVAVGKPGYDGVQITGQDPRHPFNVYNIARSDADYVDLHLYPLHESWSLSEHMDSMLIGPTLKKGKPIFIGEYGAFRDSIPIKETALQRLSDFLDGTCNYGAVGWLFWSWDSTVDPRGYTLVESDRFLDHALAKKMKNLCN